MSALLGLPCHAVRPPHDRRDAAVDGGVNIMRLTADAPETKDETGKRNDAGVIQALLKRFDETAPAART